MGMPLTGLGPLIQGYQETKAILLPTREVRGTKAMTHTREDPDTMDIIPTRAHREAKAMIQVPEVLEPEADPRKNTGVIGGKDAQAVY